MIAILLAGALTLIGQMPPLELYTYLPVIRTHVQLGEGPDAADAGPCCDNTVVVPTGEVDVEQPEQLFNTVYVRMVYTSQLGHELEAGSGNSVYLYNPGETPAAYAERTNSQSIATFDDIPTGTYNIHGILIDNNPFYDYHCEKPDVTIDQGVQTEKLVCVPYWTLRLPWTKGT